MKDERAVSLPIYSEKQYFPKWLLLIIAVAGLLPFIIVSAVHTFPVSLIMTSLIPTVLIFALFLSCNLRTEVFSDGIRYRFFPFHLHRHFIPNNEIEKIYVRKYSPLRDYGGWGIRWGRERKWKSFSFNSQGCFVGLESVSFISLRVV